MSLNIDKEFDFHVYLYLEIFVELLLGDLFLNKS